jgi:hypothetical protein
VYMCAVSGFVVIYVPSQMSRVGTHVHDTYPTHLTWYIYYNEDRNGTHVHDTYPTHLTWYIYYNKDRNGTHVHDTSCTCVPFLALL